MKNHKSWVATLVLLLMTNHLFCAPLKSANLVDPTRPPNFVAAGVAKSYGSYVLFATYIYPHYRAALINGNLYKTGDRLDEFTITNITPYTVELMGSQNHKEVLLLATPIKTRVQ